MFAPGSVVFTFLGCSSVCVVIFIKKEFPLYFPISLALAVLVIINFHFTDLFCWFVYIFEWKVQRIDCSQEANVMKSCSQSNWTKLFQMLLFTVNTTRYFLVHDVSWSATERKKLPTPESPFTAGKSFLIRLRTSCPWSLQDELTDLASMPPVSFISLGHVQLLSSESSHINLHKESGWSKEELKPWLFLYQNSKEARQLQLRELTEMFAYPCVRIYPSVINSVQVYHSDMKLL